MIGWEVGPVIPLVSPAHDYITTGGGIIVALIGVLGVLIERGRRASVKAARFAEPTGNGFAQRTDDANAATALALARIERDLGGIRSELRTVTTRVDGTTERLNAHLDSLIPKEYHQ